MNKNRILFVALSNEDFKEALAVANDALKSSVMANYTIELVSSLRELEVHLRKISDLTSVYCFGKQTEQLGLNILHHLMSLGKLIPVMLVFKPESADVQKNIGHDPIGFIHFDCPIELAQKASLN